MRNYSICYIIAIIINAIASLWFLFFVNEGNAEKRQKIIENKINENKVITRKNSQNSDISSKRNIDDKTVHPLKLLFDFENIRSMIRVCFKQRPNKGRTQLLIIFSSMIIIFMDFSGLS